ncbi:hypothetical protein CH373_00565 [Leptospira perolatii]|uniref:Uncharacterized protein n=1 Tax=Leptospira perolatii TaxID=2023191 RepID=A0A2M9ZR79_9LEPT|nr:hypothetical protein [Leptospira perolatii]PJZ71055.1 hypothetical protein CH360_00565 [Leptospira perolatii]PJZ74587.1 hypothetical protein CH373_00565 [Leptospira perolatii]
MRLSEVKELNLLLSSLGEKKNEKLSIFIDNLHTPYFEFPSTYDLPSTSVFEVDYKAAQQFLNVAGELIPELIANCFVLPEPRPKRETDRLYLVRPIYSEGQVFQEHSEENWKQKPPPYLLVLSFHLMYLGGASSSDIVSQAHQGRTMSVRTNRIYYLARIVPIESLNLEEGTILDFVSKKYKETEFMVQVGRDPGDKIYQTFSEIFDEVDYSRQIKAINEVLGIQSNDWRLGRIFEPLAVEYLTLTPRFLDSSAVRIANEFLSFRQVVDLLLGSESMTLQNQSKDSLFAWLRSFRAERILSPSGNMAWKVFREELTSI